MNFKFVHAADLHLDSPLSGLNPPPWLERTVREATFTAFRRIVDVCLREQVLFLALAGDLFEQEDRSVRARLFLREQFQRLDRAGIRTFIVHGNHDPLGPGTDAKLPGSVVVFGPSWSEVALERDGRTVARVQGISYPRREVHEDLSRHFHRVGPEPTIGVLHANLGASDGHANYAPTTVADLAARQLDYWALGHVHTRAEHPLPGGGTAAYPGNPQGRHPNETGPRGCLLVEVEDRKVSTRFVPVDAVRWERLEVDIGGAANVEALAEALDAALDAVQAGEAEASAVRVSLTGRGPLHAALTHEAVCELAEDLRRRLSEGRRPLLIESVVARTRPALDLDAVRTLGGLPAAVWDLREDPEVLALALGLEELKALEARLRQHRLPGLREQGAGLQRAAAERALALLVGEGP